MTVLTPGVYATTSPPGPLQAAALWHADGKKNMVFLDGAQSGAYCRGHSILAVEPVEILRGRFPDDLPLLKRWMTKYHQPTSKGAKDTAPSGGLFGWIGFEGEFILGVYPQFYVFDHHSGSWQGQVPELPLSMVDAATHAEPPSQPALHFRPQVSKQAFCQQVQRTLDYIAAGDIYQVNLSYPWLAARPDSFDSWRFFERLREVSPAPYGAYLSLGGTEVCSASPECFVKLSGKKIVTRPIKGTRPRGADAQLDERLARELKGSSKERAELVMITDLERNDLGQICEYGSVRVTGLCELERYAQVQHLVSTVEGRLRDGIDHLEALAACFPGGSISGAPKKRALEIIRELEGHERGLYTGAIGYFGFNGESQFSIAIRTAWTTGDHVRFDVGAGIVTDSIPEKEWEETLHKAAGILKAAEGG